MNEPILEDRNQTIKAPNFHSKCIWQSAFAGEFSFKVPLLHRQWTYKNSNKDKGMAVIVSQQNCEWVSLESPSICMPFMTRTSKGQRARGLWDPEILTPTRRTYFLGHNKNV